jgi:hypothetical protein
LPTMGRSGTKPRMGKKQQHLPKVGTPAERHYEQQHERDAVLSNMGVRSKGPMFWIAVVLIVAIVVFGMVAWIFAT